MKIIETYPLYIIVRSSRPKYRCLWIQLKKKRLHVSIETAMPLPSLRSITPICITFFILNNQYSWPIIFSAVQLNNYPFDSYLKNSSSNRKTEIKIESIKHLYFLLEKAKRKYRQIINTTIEHIHVFIIEELFTLWIGIDAILYRFLATTSIFLDQLRRSSQLKVRASMEAVTTNLYRKIHLV